MSQFVKAALLASLTGFMAQAHATNIAVADSRVAMMTSAEAKRTIETLNTSIKPQLENLKQLQTEIEALRSRAEKDGKVMSEADQKKLQSDYQGKLTKYQGIKEGVDKRLEDAQSKLLQTLLPKTEKAIEQLRSEGKYDAIIEKQNVIWADPSIDITDKITKRLDSAK